MQTRLYSLFHLNLAFSSIEEEERLAVIERCYWPLLKLAETTGAIAIELSGLTLEEIAARDMAWIAKFKKLWCERKLQVIGSGYAQIIGPLVPPEVTRWNLKLGLEVLEKHLGRTPDVALMNEQAFSAGLVPLYSDAGFRAVVADWSDTASHHADWPEERMWGPQKVLGANGCTLDLIWSNAIAFQKLQRYAHGELSLGHYLDWLAHVCGNGAIAFPVYGSDAEIFNYRPGRFDDEADIHANEWQRIETLYEALAKDSRYELVLPDDILKLEKKEQEPLVLETCTCPVPVKKQRKYNIARWAVTGRGDFALNSRCWRLFKMLQDSSNSNPEDWKEMCTLWASDFRTHITEDRWAEFLERLGRAEAKISRSARPRAKLPMARKAENVGVSQDEHFLDIETPTSHLRLNLWRGLAIDSFLPKGAAGSNTGPWIGTLPHGYFNDIEWGADFYSGHFTYERPGLAKVTDLARVDPRIGSTSTTGAIDVSAIVRTPLGSIRKRWRVYSHRARLDCVYELPEVFARAGVLRLGNITLNPECFDRDQLVYRCHNGGEEAEEFRLNNGAVDHGAPVSSLVTSRHGTGLTGGSFEFADAAKTVRISFDQGAGAYLGLVSMIPVRDNFFCRLLLSAGEIDDTRRDWTSKNLPPVLKLGFRIDLLQS